MDNDITWLTVPLTRSQMYEIHQIAYAQHISFTQALRELIIKALENE